jgi:tetratricopeptide (TPR) repeat protein
MAMDTDPVRNAIREAVLQKNESGILNIAQQEEAGAPDATTALSLATALHPVRESERSIRILADAARRHPDDLSVRAVLGELLLDRDPTQALLHLSVAEGLQPMSPYVLQLLGRVHRRLGNQTLALDCSKRAVELHPSEPQARIHLGLALRDTGDEAGAAESLAVAEELDPGCLEEYVRIHVRISRDARSEGHFDQAEWYARRAADVGTESAPAHFWLGLALNDKGKYDEAIESFRRAIEINPTHGEASNSLAASLRNAGRIDEAIESYRRQIAITPNHLFAHVGLGIVLADKGLYEEAIESIQRQIDLRPRHPHLRLNLAWVHFHAGAFDAALESYDKAMQLDPNYCYAYHTMTFFFAHAPEPEFRDPEEAVRLGERAVELHVGAPTYGAAHTLTLEWEMLGQAYYRAGRFEDCIEALEKSIELAVRGAEATHTLFLAMAHKQLGHDGEAREHYDAAVSWMESHELNVTDGSDLTRWRDEARKIMGN